MLKTRLVALALLIGGVLIAWFVYSSEVNPNSAFKFKLGLDLDGGTHLTYGADTRAVEEKDIDGAMDALRQTIEKRVNILGVSEPIIQVEKSGFLGDDASENRLTVELPGVTDVNEAIRMIGQTPLLEFKILTNDTAVLDSVTATSTPEQIAEVQSKMYIPTGLTGAQMKRASLVFDNYSRQPIVSIEFNTEGKELLSKLTKDNVGRIMAIFLDGTPISSPVIRDEITAGTAQITGDFSPAEAKKLVQNLNFGALPLPIKLLETESIGASLGQNTLDKGVKALTWSLAFIFIFMILLYRLPGVIASISLMMYVVIMLALFKFIPVILTSAGLAGFVLSLGMAVDANILIFARLKEELRLGLSVFEAVSESTRRAWSSIRDGNLSSLISAVILFWMSGSSLVKGFSLVFALGVIVSMFTAIVISKWLLLAISTKKVGSKLQVLFAKK